MSHALCTRPVPGACAVVLVKAWHLTDAHVIRLGREQGTYQPPRWPTTARMRTGTVDVRHTWREVLDVYRDRADLEAVFGQWQPACVQPGCHARLRGTGWHVPPGFSTTDAHEHQPATRPGQLNEDLARIADQVWEDSGSSILIRVFMHEVSDPGQVEDLFVILNRNDLIEAQSLPAAGRETAWDGGLSGEFTAAMLDRLIRSAGELWHSTGGHDPHGVLSAAQREALDLAAAAYRAALNREMGGGEAGPVCPACGSGQWDWISNDRARCTNGHEWDQPAGDDLAQLEGRTAHPARPAKSASQKETPPLTDAPAAPGPICTSPGTADDPLFAVRKLCDGCYEQVTGLRAECLDLCSLPLDHAGLCDPRAETSQRCERCGETGYRLTEHEPQDAMEAAACLPLDIPARIADLEAVAAGCSTSQGDGHCDDAGCPLCEPALARELAVLRGLAGAEFDVTYWVPTQYQVRVSAVQTAATLRRAGWPDEAVTALRIATGDITDGDATDEGAGDAAPDGPDLHSLAYAVRKASNELGVAGPAGEAGDWDTPETYHVHLLPGRPAAGAGSEATDAPA